MVPMVAFWWGSGLLRCLWRDRDISSHGWCVRGGGDVWWSDMEMNLVLNSTSPFSLHAEPSCLSPISSLLTHTPCNSIHSHMLKQISTKITLGFTKSWACALITKHTPFFSFIYPCKVNFDDWLINVGFLWFCFVTHKIPIKNTLRKKYNTC